MPGCDDFHVQVLERYFPGVGNVTHLKVSRVDGKDGITWDELQEIKNEYLGKYITAVEVYPASADLINETNMRHLFVLPTLVPNLRR
jgi:hypothetical protein